jgi:hypothetical protein
MTGVFLEKCGFCGFTNSDNMHFCRKCGKPLSVQKAGKGGSNRDGGEAGRAKSPVRAISLCFAVLLAIAAVLFLLDGRKAIQIGKFTYKEGLASFTGGGAPDGSANAGGGENGEAGDGAEPAGSAPPTASPAASPSAPPEASPAASPSALPAASPAVGSTASSAPSPQPSPAPSGDAADALDGEDRPFIHEAAEALKGARILQTGGGAGRSFDDLFEFLMLNEEAAPDGRYIMGAIRNKSEYDFAPIELEFAFFDESGKQLYTETASNEQLFAFNTWLFKIKISDESAVSFSISALRLNGIEQ